MKSKMHAFLALILCFVLLGCVQPIQRAELQPLENENLEVVSVEEPIPAETGSSTSLRANMVKNGGFENEDQYDGEGEWRRSGSIYRELEFDYGDNVNSGNYAFRVQVEGGDHWGDLAYVQKSYYTNEMGYLSEGSVLNFYYNIINNPDVTIGARVYVQIRYYNGTNYYMNYYLSAPSIYSNGTYSGYYLLNTTTFGDWINLNRNLTADFEAAIGHITNDLQIQTINFYTLSPGNPSGILEMLLDDVSLTNSTGYQYLENGDFETGTSYKWYRSFNSVKGYYSHTAESTEGNFAANLTVNTDKAGVYGLTELSQGFTYRSDFWALEMNMITLEFDWMYSDVSGGGDYQNAYYCLTFRNNSFYGGLYWFLGSDKDQMMYSNSTSSNYAFYYITAPQFGVRDTWNHFKIDVYDVFRELNISQVAYYQTQFVVTLGDRGNSSATLLLDRVSLNAYPLSDSGFEVDYGYEENLPGWGLWTGSKTAWTQTADAKVGDYSANMTLTSSSNQAIYRYTYWEIDQWTYTDFWWKLDELSQGTGSSVAYLRMDFEGGYDLRYVLAASQYIASNTTSRVTYFVDGLNSTGAWMNIHRNITHDLDEAFGQHLWNITRFMIYVTGTDGGKISILFDELHFRDMKSPEVLSLQRNPETPEYDETVDIDIYATDNLAGVDEVVLFYRDDADWNSVEAEYIIGKWTVSLPELAYGIRREYYVEVTDRSGMKTVDDNSGVYYSYSSTDSVNPSVTISTPTTNATIVGSVGFEILAQDPGVGSSGIVYVEVWNGPTLIYNGSSAPFDFTWDSRTSSNGTKNIGAYAYDAAGNVAQDNITLDVQNDVASPLIYGLQINPTAPEYGVEVMISIVSDDVSGVKNVTLFYAVENPDAFSSAQAWNLVEMEKTGSLYTALIPAQEYGRTVLYYIVSYDNFGQAAFIGTEDSPLSYYVDDTRNPIISVLAPSASIPLRDTVSFDIFATDEGSGIEEVRFYVNAALIDEFAGGSGSFEWDTTSFENGEYTVRFVAIDGAGNQVSRTLQYEVLNPDAFGAFGESLSGLFAAYGVFIGLAAGIVIILVIQRALKGKGK